MTLNHQMPYQIYRHDGGDGDDCDDNDPDSPPTRQQQQQEVVHPQKLVSEPKLAIQQPHVSQSLVAMAVKLQLSAHLKLQLQ
jgi:hypothetical protein